MNSRTYIRLAGLLLIIGGCVDVIVGGFCIHPGLGWILVGVLTGLIGAVLLD